MFKRKPFKLIIVLSVIFSLTTSSCSKNNNMLDNETKFSGQDLFKAIYFAVGPAASRLESSKVFYEEIKKMEKSDKEFVNRENKFFNQINLEIVKINPNFFSEFKADIESKNLYRIEVAVKKGGEILLDAMNNVPQYKKVIQDAKQLIAELQNEKTVKNKLNGKLSSRVNSEVANAYMDSYYLNSEEAAACTPGLAVCVALAAVVWEVGVVVNMGVAINMGAAVYVAVIYKTKIWVSSLSEDEREISEEAMVTEISNAY